MNSLGIEKACLFIKSKTKYTSPTTASTILVFVLPEKENVVEKKKKSIMTILNIALSSFIFLSVYHSVYKIAHQFVIQPDIPPLPF